MGHCRFSDVRYLDSMFFNLEKVRITFLLKVFSQRLHWVLQLTAPLPINMCSNQVVIIYVYIQTALEPWYLWRTVWGKRENEQSLLVWCIITVLNQMPRHLSFSLPIFVQLLFEGSIYFFGKPADTNNGWIRYVQAIQRRLLDVFSSKHSLSLLLPAVERVEQHKQP